MKLSITILSCIFSASLSAQIPKNVPVLLNGQYAVTHVAEVTAAAIIPAKPKLVVGIVVDQMRYDYIYRYWDKFGNDGFKRLVNEGFFCRNTNYNYVPTYTGPGHTSIYTGTTPAVHGIIANEWFDKTTGKNLYCVEDENVSEIGRAHV